MAGQRLVLGSETRLSLGRYHRTMTNGGLAKSYMFKAEKRLKILSVLLEEERELSFYGDIDFIPTEEYSREDALQAIEDAKFIVKTVKGLLEV
jgi:HEPN domain-containing protein